MIVSRSFVIILLKFFSLAMSFYVWMSELDTRIWPNQVIIIAKI